jgi:GT2 family glycosyltransferase
MAGGQVDAVVIGRNEGARLTACLDSLAGQVRRLVYVDSGSTDGSLAAARTRGAEVVSLDMTQPFTAARARNAGLALLADDPPQFVQFVDGDCEVRPDWIATAATFLQDHPEVVVVCGRRRERFPEASVWNRLCDREWDTPVGEATACGGDALMRHGAVAAVGGYDPTLIAGEEPDLCLRLRRAGGRIWRLEAEMTLHDAAMTRFGQWWRRSRRAGHAFAEGAWRHRSGTERHWQRETRRALLWGVGVPVAAVLAGVLHPAGWLVLGLWPAQVLRLAPRMGDEAAVFTVLGKLPEAQGVIGYHLGRLRGRQRGLIEYK